MRFEVLGPLSVSQHGEAVPVGGRKQRTLLAVLLLHANEAVPRDHLVAALWVERPPPSAAKSLDTYVYRLRKLLGHDRLEREPGGYLLRVEPGELDAGEFERLVASAGAAAEGVDYETARTELVAALGLWRGPAWDGLLASAALDADARRLEELRLGALESRFEAELVLGNGVELAPELERLVDEHPLRERLIASLMLALYRAGRQTDALDAFQTARRRLVDELGLEPGPELHELQRRILGHDPILGAPRRLGSLSGPRRARALAGAALAAVAAVIAGAFVLSTGAAGQPQGLAPGVGGIVSVDAGSGRVASATPLTGAPGSVTATGGSVWVADPVAERVLQIDPGSRSVIDSIPVGAEPGSIVSGDGAVWVASTVGSTVTRIDARTDTAAPLIDLPGANPGAIAYGAGGLWVADSVERELFEIDTATDTLARTIQLDLQPSAITTADGAVWVAGYGNAMVEKLDPVSGKVIGRVHVGDGPVALALAAGSLWVANSLDSTVSRVDPTTMAVKAVVAVGSGPAALAAGPRGVWVANQYSGTVSRIDPERDQTLGTVTVGGSPTSLTIAAGRLWVGVPAASGSHRGGTLVIVTPGPLTSSQISGQTSDPAFYTNASPPQFTGLAWDALVSFQQSTGAGGLRLIPDLAVSIPTPTDGGRTYAFLIRPGIRYSDGQPLRAADFRRGVERLFRDSSPGISMYADLLGATACVRHPDGCNLSEGIVTNDARGTVVFHFTEPDPEFLYQLTESFSAPVPPGTPNREPGQRTVPGTGPYKIASISPTEIRFVRNPYFHEWSNAAQPAGNPNEIVWQSAPSQQAAVSAVEQGHADWLFGQPPLAEYHQLELQYPGQLHINPQWAVNFVAINTHVPPFNDLRVRQALNYAINRAKIVQLYGGPAFAAPSCQAIVPGIPGYRRYCPYTLHGRADGAWTGPDMARARQLVAQSGTIGARVDVVGPSANGFTPTAITGHIAGVLRKLGYRVRVSLIPFASITPAMWDSFQLNTFGGWTGNYPDPSSYVPLFFSCGGANGNDYYCNPAIDHEMQRAELLELTNQPAADALWEVVDRQLTNSAEWVTTVDTREVEITSTHLRNYEYNPVWGFLADQSWLR